MLALIVVRELYCASVKEDEERLTYDLIEDESDPDAGDDDDEPENTFCSKVSSNSECSLVCTNSIDEVVG